MFTVDMPPSRGLRPEDAAPPRPVTAVIQDDHLPMRLQQKRPRVPHPLRGCRPSWPYSFSQFVISLSPLERQVRLSDCCASGLGGAKRLQPPFSSNDQALSHDCQVYIQMTLHCQGVFEERLEIGESCTVRSLGSDAAHHGVPLRPVMASAGRLKETTRLSRSMVMRSSQGF